MRRRIIAAVWVTGAIVPLLAAVVFLAGCCVLPFHHVLHRLMPICQTAAIFIRGDHAAHDQGTPAAPAREKEEPVKRFATPLPGTFRLAMSATAAAIAGPASETAYRSFISLGAVRCDQDVGLYVLADTFRI